MKNFATNESMIEYAKTVKLSEKKMTLANAPEGMVEAYNVKEINVVYAKYMVDSGLWAIASAQPEETTQETTDESVQDAQYDLPAAVDSTNDLPDSTEDADDALGNLHNDEDSGDGASDDDSTPALLTTEQSKEVIALYGKLLLKWEKADASITETLDALGATIVDKPASYKALQTTKNVYGVSAKIYADIEILCIKLGDVEITEAMVKFAQENARTPFEKYNEKMESFVFSQHKELDLLLTALAKEIDAHFGEYTIYTLNPATSKIEFTNPHKETRKRATTSTDDGDETMTIHKTKYTVKDGVNVERTGKDWKITLTTKDGFYFVTATKGKSVAEFTGRFDAAQGDTFPVVINKAYKFCTSAGGRVSVTKFLPAHIFVFAEA